MAKRSSSKDMAVDNVRKSLHMVLRNLVFRMPAPEEIRELPVSQLRCLFIVGDAEGLRLHDLALRMEVKLPAASQIVDRLVKRGHLERRIDPEDRRAVRIYLTQSSREMHYAGIARHIVAMDKVCSKLNVEEVSQIADALTTLADAATKSEAELNVIAAEYHPDFIEAERVLEQRGMTPKPFEAPRSSE